MVWPDKSLIDHHEADIWHSCFFLFFFYITLKTSVLQKPTWGQLLPNKAAMMPKLQNNIRANRMWPPLRQTILLAASGRLLGEIPQSLHSQLPWLALDLASLSSDKTRQVSQLGALIALHQSVGSRHPVLKSGLSSSTAHSCRFSHYLVSRGCFMFPWWLRLGDGLR